MKICDVYPIILIFTLAYISLVLYGILFYFNCCGVPTTQTIINILLRLDSPTINGLSVLYIAHYIAGLHIMLRGEELLNGIFWGLLTSLFIHANIYHLFFNSLALLIIKHISSAMNNAYNLIKVFLIGGLLSNLGTALITPTTSSVGASGGIFAVFTWTALINYIERRDNTLLILLFLTFILSSTPIAGSPNVVAHILGVLVGCSLVVFKKGLIS
ncbi:MAG: rhomboid family intramembrane serine protease [Sulfolobales archaeon]